MGPSVGVDLARLVPEADEPEPSFFAKNAFPIVLVVADARSGRWRACPRGLLGALLAVVVASIFVFFLALVVFTGAD